MDGNLLIDMKSIEQTLITSDFNHVYLPYLTGSEKQIAWGRNIRALYVDILQRKLKAILPSKHQERQELLLKFNQYVNCQTTRAASFWIEHHCSRCGCILKTNGKMSRCSDPTCGYTKKVSNG